MSARIRKKSSPHDAGTHLAALWHMRPTAVFAITLLLVACADEGSLASLAASAPTERSSPSATPSPPSTGATDRATSEPTAAETPFGAGIFEDPDDCEDDSVGYRVAFPDAWWWNEPFDSPIGPHVQCRYFAPEAFDVRTVNREQPVPEGVAVTVTVIPPGDAGVGLSGEVVASEEVTVADRPATTSEQVHAPGGFLSPGERLYQYLIDLGDGRDLLFVTGNSTGDYSENRRVLDGMMESLELFEPGEVCGPEGDRFVCGEIIVGLRDGAGISMDEVVARNSHGGSPSRIVERLEGINAFVLAVPHGTEGGEIGRYLTDEAVEYAVLNGAEGGVAD